MNKTNRPVNLDLRTIQFPATAIASILHRVSGVVLFVGIGILMPCLYYSLQSESDFFAIGNLLSMGVSKFILWGIITALIYHVVAGVRHLIMDLGFWETLESGTWSAHLGFVITIILSVATGVWLWS